MNIVLNEKTQDSIRDLMAPPSGAISLDEHLQNYSRALCRIMKCRYHAIVLFPGYLNDEILLSSNNPPDFEACYNSKLQDKDFILQELMEHPQKVVHLKDLLEQKENRESVFYREAQRIRPAGDCLYAPIHIEGLIVGFFGQVRSVNGGDFTEADKNLMMLLSPALSCHLQIYRERNNPVSSGNGSHYDFQRIKTQFRLSDRELEILNLIFRGLTNKQISAELNIQESTVKRHISNTFEKTGSGNRTQLIFNTALS